MSGNKFTAGLALAGLVRAGVLPVNGVSDVRRGRFDWESDVFAYRLWLSRASGDEPSGLSRQLDVMLKTDLPGIEREDFRLSIIPLETAPGEDDQAELARFVTTARSVVKNLEDFCLLALANPGTRSGLEIAGPASGASAVLLYNLATEQHLSKVLSAIRGVLQNPSPEDSTGLAAADVARIRLKDLARQGIRVPIDPTWLGESSPERVPRIDWYGLEHDVEE